MSTILFFDTETARLPDKDQYGNPHHHNSPLPVSIAALLTDYDFNIVGELNVFVKHSQPIDPGAAAVHGITQDVINAKGVDLVSAQRYMEEMALPASTIVGHNVAFDRMVMQATYNNPLYGTGTERPKYLSKDNVPYICTMHATTKLCKLPGPRGFKWPKLTEAYRHFFGEDFSGAHDAMADIRATLRLFQHLVVEGHIKL